jgi:hypothetical protein
MVGEVGLDEGAVAGVFKNNARQLRSKKHSGNESSHFLEMAATPENQSHNRATVSSNNRSTSGRRSNRDRRVNLNQSKLLRRVFTSAICPSTQPRAISSSFSTALAMSKTPKS